MENWFVPLTILPSVGFFIVSTSSVSNSLSAEIARLIELDQEGNRVTLQQKIRQMRLVNISLVFLYGSAALLAVAGLISGLQHNLMVDSLGILTEVLLCLGIGLTVAALCMLMVYAFRAVRIKEQQHHNMTS